MQYFKPLTHLGNSTHGNSLKVAQFCGKNIDLETMHPTRAAVVRFDWPQVKNTGRDDWQDHAWVFTALQILLIDKYLIL